MPAESLVRLRAEQDRLTTELEMAHEKAQTYRQGQEEAQRRAEELGGQIREGQARVKQLERLLLDAQTEIRRRQGDQALLEQQLARAREDENRLKVDLRIKQIEVRADRPTQQQEEAGAPSAAAYARLERELFASKTLARELQGELEQMQVEYTARTTALERDLELIKRVAPARAPAPPFPDPLARRRAKFATSQREVRRLEQEVGTSDRPSSSSQPPAAGLSQKNRAGFR